MSSVSHFPFSGMYNSIHWPKKWMMLWGGCSELTKNKSSAEENWLSYTWHGLPCQLPIALEYCACCEETFETSLYDQNHQRVTFDTDVYFFLYIESRVILPQIERHFLLCVPKFLINSSLIIEEKVVNSPWIYPFSTKINPLTFHEWMHYPMIDNAYLEFGLCRIMRLYGYFLEMFIRCCNLKNEAISLDLEPRLKNWGISIIPLFKGRC